MPALAGGLAAGVLGILVFGFVSLAALTGGSPRRIAALMPMSSRTLAPQQTAMDLAIHPRSPGRPTEQVAGLAGAEEQRQPAGGPTEAPSDSAGTAAPEPQAMMDPDPAPGGAPMFGGGPVPGAAATSPAASAFSDYLTPQPAPAPGEIGAGPAPVPPEIVARILESRPTSPMSGTPAPTVDRAVEPERPPNQTRRPTETAGPVPRSSPFATLLPAAAPSSTGSPAPTATATPTVTPSSTPAPAPTASDTPQPTVTATATPEPTPTDVRAPEPIATPTQTPVPTPTVAPEPPATPTGTPEPAATPTHTPAPPATPPPAPTTGSASLIRVFYHGANGVTESDEHVALMARGGSPLDVGGWLIHAEKTGAVFIFPVGTVLEPAREYRVYTNEIHLESGGFSFGSDVEVWNNGRDCGYLFDPSGVQVSSICYSAAAHPGGR